MTDEIGRDEMKAAFKEAAKEFLQEKWTEGTSFIGKWFLGVIAAGICAGVLWLILTANGWRQP